MYKKKVYSEDTLERWEKNYHDNWVDRDKQEMLEEYFQYKTNLLVINIADPNSYFEFCKFRYFKFGIFKKE